ncbi:MAG TPA: succinyl-diaminopimelate desuccinylase [Baekduia sp.]|nr:succinyl-diaminopimelate desuccinylase [Baekduia sp.]
MPDLAARTLELVDIASESRSEAEIVAHVTELVGGVDAGDTCILAGVTERRDRPLVLLAGHLDTVPAQGNLPGRHDGTHVHGAGASDMKAGIAVMIELILDPPTDATVDLGFVFFGREELPFNEMALTPLLRREPSLATADLAIVLEPTANDLHAGCLGNINATWNFSGRSGHSARPWLADNAITRAAAGIGALAAIAPVEHEFGELTYKEVVTVVGVAGGIARNVIPGEASAQVNMRYAPGTPATEAEARLHELCDPYGDLVIDSNSPSGPVAQGELVQRLVAAGDLAVQPKQAWTPVAEFGLIGVPAVNFGPGDPNEAHMRDEKVAVAALERADEILRAFACA